MADKILNEDAKNIIIGMEGNLREHELSVDCWCKPNRDPEEPGVIIHNHINNTSNQEKD